MNKEKVVLFISRNAGTFQALTNLLAKRVPYFTADFCPSLGELYTCIEKEPYSALLVDVYSVQETEILALLSLRARLSQPLLLCALENERRFSFSAEFVAQTKGVPLYVQNEVHDILCSVLFAKPFCAPEDLYVTKKHMHAASLKPHGEKSGDFASKMSTAPKISIEKTNAMADFLKAVHCVSQTTECVLLLGESGSGKTRTAKLIHEASDRRAKPFVHVNVAEFNEHFIESFLFGTVRGAFTGAQNTSGALQEANGGTLFFDEIAELPLHLQAKLLHIIDFSLFRRLGSLTEQHVDVRFLFATNVDLYTAVQEKRFREDLFHRINTLTLQVPPLREHRDDIPDLARQFAREKNVALSEGALTKLCTYSWPGNIRQLKNTIFRASVFSRHKEILAEDISFY